MSAKQARAAKARKRALGAWGYMVYVGDSTGANAYCEVVSLFPPVVRFNQTFTTDDIRVVSTGFNEMPLGLIDILNRGDSVGREP